MPEKSRTGGRASSVPLTGKISQGMKYLMLQTLSAIQIKTVWCLLFTEKVAEDGGPWKSQSLSQMWNYRLVFHEMLDSKIGYIRITQFTGVTGEQYQEAFDDLQKQGMEKMIVDLRDNPGGLLDSVCDVLRKILRKTDRLHRR